MGKQFLGVVEQGFAIYPVQKPSQPQTVHPDVGKNEVLALDQDQHPK